MLMISVSDLVPGLLRPLSRALYSCPCFQNIAQSHLTRTLFSVSLVVFFSSAFPCILSPHSSPCMSNQELTDVASNALFLEVHTFQNQFNGSYFRTSPYVLFCLSSNLSSAAQDRKDTALFI